ncbi:restriction endonuclease subunit S [Vibrio fluvialis]|uniref:restriction endonuclease subunit S n=1 Tax=Vibrio fluvialis TaxID=676 RepID=UPI001EE9C6BA|nr:restriction endonuclease subunit S [Vibrio fluvialis]MCG6340584.1 restriction endonuclease subunit S [Vibrio fluvialis]
MKLNKQVVPAGYKNTDVGCIPSDWDVKKLREISPSQSVGLVINPSSYYSEHGTVPMLTGSHVRPNRINYTQAKKITVDSNARLPASRLNQDDLVTVRVGAPGITAVIPPELHQANCASMMIIRRSEKFNSDWLCYLMNSKQGRTQIESVQYGTAQKQFNIVDAVDFIFPLPRIEEQTAIANALSDVDALISELEKLIAKKQAIKTATMQQLLTGKKRLPQFAKSEDGTPKGYKKSELGNTPEDWDIGSVGDRSVSYSGGTPSTSNKSFYGGNISWITSSDLNKSFIYEVEGRITEAGLQGSSAKLVDAGTFLIALYGATAGVCAITKIKAAINQAVLAVASSLWSAEFLFYWFTNNKNKLIETYTQGGQPNLSGDIVRSIRMSIPPMREQKEIVSVLSDMDDELQALEKRLKKTRQIKQGMMQELLTGKTRLVKPESK